jgi:PAS domain S-box-containing protein
VVEAISNEPWSRDQLLAEIEQLRERERRYRAYVDKGPHAIYVLDTGGRFIDVNPAACLQSGYSQRELLALAVDDLAASDELVDAFAALRRVGALSAEATLRRKDGSRFAASVDAVRLSEDSFLAYVTDISELREHEDALRRERDRAQGYLDTVEAVIVALDVEGRISLLNRNGCRLLGYREDEILGKQWFATCLPQPEGLEEVYPYFRKLIAGEAVAVEHFENQVVTRTGERRDIAWHNTLLHDSGGAIVGTLSAGEDITERRKLEQHLQQSSKMEALGTLAGGIAHDMNNVLAMVMGLAGVVTMQLSAGHPARRNVREIIEATERGKKLVQNLLGFARKGQYEKRLVSVNDLIRRLVLVLRQSLPKRISLDLALDDDLGAMRGDEIQISQTVMNLCINAADAIRNSGTITISTRTEQLETGDVPQLTAGSYVRIDVRDDGCGMTDEVRAKAFEPFFTTKQVGRGTGLGLSMAYGVAANHHGAVSIDSGPGRGTTVTLRFPAAGDAPRRAPTADDALRLPRTESRGATVLVVDDERLVRAAMCRMLEVLDYHPLSADGGQAAVDLYRERGGEIDLVLLDLSMPGMGGADCFAKLRAIDPDVRVLICTGHGEEQTTDELRRTGAIGIVRKPIRLEQLADLVEDALAADVGGSG